MLIQSPRRRTDKKIETYDTDGKKQNTSEHFDYLGHDIVLQYNDDVLSHRYLHHPDVVDQCLADEDIAGDNALYPLLGN